MGWKVKLLIAFTVISTLLTVAAFFQAGDFLLRYEGNDVVCNQSLWQHVYSSDRLEVIEQCIKVTGTIKKIVKTGDGDLHVMVQLDDEYESLLNDVNKEQLDSLLVVEPICEYKPKFDSAANACEGAAAVDVPPQGSHVTIIGSYVLDKSHGWMEIHPASEIQADQS